LAALAVFVVVLVAADGAAAAHRPRCVPRHARTVRRGKNVVFFVKRAVLYGCVLPTGSRIALGDDYAQIKRVVGRFVLVLNTQCGDSGCTSDNASVSLDLVDLRNGKRASFDASFGYPSPLYVSRAGAMATVELDGYTSSFPLGNGVPAIIERSGRAEVVQYGLSGWEIWAAGADGTPVEVQSVARASPVAIWEATAGDVNGDGIPDLVSVNDGNLIIVNLGQPSGTFDASVSSKSQSLGQPALISVDGGTLPDLATEDHGFVTLYDNAGGGRFSGPSKLKLPSAEASVTGIIAADVNNDGHTDLVISSDSAVYVAYGRGGLAFDAPSALGLPAPDRVVVADVNGDGRPDLLESVFGRVQGGCLIEVLGQQAGGFAAPVQLGCHGYWAMTVGDVDGDGKLDVVADRPGAIDVLPGAGDGTFGPPITTTTDVFPGELTLADLTADGRPDLILTGGDTVLMPNLGGDTFRPVSDLGTIQLADSAGTHDIASGPISNVHFRGHDLDWTANGQPQSHPIKPL
jgi:hypothetical protein